MDSTAISLCKEQQSTHRRLQTEQAGNIKRVVTGEKVGSLVSA